MLAVGDDALVRRLICPAETGLQVEPVALTGV
jgi:hypothetical protein